MKRAYYNEIEPYAAQWLRNLIAAGHIAPGDVDERSIVDVRGEDLAGYDQCHFFAGIGGWSYALRLAGWPDDRPVWTGSCPCQPFSAAGKGKAADDERHLWPSWFSLIAERRPAIVFGEQVEAAIGWGWLDLVFTDLEKQSYSCGASILPACGVGAPHIRNRIWFVADAGHNERPAWPARGEQQSEPSIGEWAGSDSAHGLAGELGDANEPGSQGRIERGNGSDQWAAGQASMAGGVVNPEGEQTGLPGRSRQSGSSAWSDIDWLPCTDGKARPVESGTFPLAHGIPGRVGRLRAFGNAITPQVAAEFIGAVMEYRPW